MATSQELSNVIPEVKSTSKVVKHWTTANLLPEALAVDLHVVEDGEMIRWLGRERFVQLSIHGTLGWQTGVFSGDDGKSRVFRCTMKQNRKHCAAIYCEDEYEKLVLEAYLQARAKTKMANNRYRFICIHCKESHKDKNTVSYHRMFNLCKVYKGEESLKMYPTWEPSNHEEKSRIVAKFGKVVLPTASQAPSLAIFPPPLDQDTPPVNKRSLSIVPAEHDFPSKKCKLTLKASPHSLPKVPNLAVKATPKFSMSPLSTKRKMKARKSPLQPKINSSQEPVNMHSSHSKLQSTTNELTPDSITISPSIPDFEFHVTKHKPVLHNHQLRPMSRNEFEEQVHKKATMFFNANIEIASPPPPVAVNGLYILITEIDKQWVPKKLIEDPDACMQYMHKQLEDGTLGQQICSAFGQWYLYDNAQSTRSFEEQNNLLDRIKAQVKCFKCNSDVQRYEELKNLKDYLQYRIKQREYEAKVVAIQVNLDNFCRNYVDAELRKFDLAKKEKEEAFKWNWSPLYHIFKKWPLRNFKDGPWDHTNTEWLEMSAVLLENTKSEPLSLEHDCPHILRALSYLIRALEGLNRPLSHPMRGLDVQYMLELARDKDHSVALTKVAQSLPTTGWSTFPGIYDAADNFEDFFLDVVALLQYDTSKQMQVVEKIQSFIGRMAHRAVADMVRMHRQSELADMWFNNDITKQRQEKCEEVLCSSLIFREDMDVGRVVLGDLHEKSKCIKLHVEEMVHSLKQLRSTQLYLMNCGLGLEDPTDNVTLDIDCTKALLGEAVVMAPDKLAPNPM